MHRRTILLMLVVWTPLTLSYEIEPIDNPMLPILKGASFITDSHFTVHYHVNLTNIKLCLEQIERTTIYLNKTVHELKKIEMSYLILTKLSHTFRTIDNLKNILNYHTNLKTDQRHKRALINIIGTAEKWLFGTLDAEDGIKYDSYIKTLQDNQHILHNDLKSQKIILKKITEAVDTQLKTITNNQAKILEKLSGLDMKEKTILTIMYILFLNDNINLELSQIESTCNNLLTAINFAQIGVMHYSIIKYKELSRILKEVNTDKIIPFDNIIKYYETMHAQVAIQNDLIIFRVHIPLIEKDPFLLYKILPIPILNRTISITHPYLLSSTNTYFTFDQECPLIENFYLCNREKLTKEDECLYLMLNLQGQCPTIPIMYKQRSIIPMSDNSLLIIPKQAETVTFQCPKQKTIEIIKQPSIILPRDCQTIIDKFQFSKQNPEIIDFRLKLPKIPLNNTFPSKEISIEVEEIDHSLIVQAKKDVNALKIHDLITLNTRYIWKDHTIVILIVTLIIAFICITVIYYFKFYRHSHDKNRIGKLGLDVQLENIKISEKSPEKPAIFSET